MTTPYARRLLALRSGAAATAPQPDAPAVQPRDGSVSVVGGLRMLLAESLGVPPEEIETARPFAELGLTSLLAVRFLDRLNRRFGLRLGVDALFAHASVVDLAAHVAPRLPRQGTSAAGIEVTPEPRGLEAPAQTGAPALPCAPPGAMDIAVIGMAGRFPGAPDIVALRRRLAAGELLVGPAPADRLSRPSARSSAGEARAGFLSGIDRFDAAFFGISPREAAAMDPQQRLFLEQCWLAVENAGLPPEAVRGRRVGVFAGAAACGYEALLPPDSDATLSHGLTGNLVSLLAARIAYALDLRGPAVVVDTACSASLVAVHLACLALRSGEVDMALAGGVRLFIDARSFATMGRVGMLSPSGRCRSFDAAADGIAVGEAAAAVLIKPLARALADGDRIDAVIRGTGINQDGRSNGITAPNGRAQAELIREVLARAGVPPSGIGLIEAHGTGTPLGDPIEVAALAEALGGGPESGSAPVLLGSVKSNIGHTSEAAGIAGLIKAVLCLKHAEVLPSIGFEAANPKAPFGAALRLASAYAPWPAPPGDAPRRAGVSAFGLSGTNAHAVLQEPPAVPRGEPAAGPWLFALSAADGPALERQAAQLAAWMRDAGPEGLRLEDVCRTLLDGRSAMDHRLAFVAAGAAEAVARLEAAAAGDARDMARLARGATRPEGDALSAPLAAAADPALRALALARLAGLWLQGAPLRGALLYPTGLRTLELPGYPFAAEAHWPAASAAPRCDGRASHALLDADGPTRTFSHHDPLVRDHVVAGAALLHAGLFLEMARLAAERAAGGAAPGSLRDIAWLRPATVPPKGELPLRIAVADGVCTLLAEGEARPFARCHVHPAAPDASAPPAQVHLAALRAAASRRMERADLTPRNDAQAAVRLGPSFPGFETLWLAPGRALARLEVPTEPFGLPPRLTDAAIQTAVALLAAQEEAKGAAAAVRYPAALGALDMLGPAPTGEAWIFAEPSADDADAVDLLLLDAAGTARQRWRGLVLRAAATPAAAEPAAEAPAPTLMRPVWVRRDALAADPSWPDLVVAGAVDRPILAGVDAPMLEPEDREGLDAAVAALDPSRAPRIWILDTASPAPADPAAAEPAAAFALHRLVRALVRAGQEKAPVALRIITANVHGVTGAEAPLNPLAAVLEGLAKAVGEEFPAWRVVICDLDLAAPAEATRIAAEPGDPNGEPVALRDHGATRSVRELRPALPGPGEALRRGGAYVVVGGMGRVGRAVCRMLARDHQARLLLVGRAPLDAERADFLAELGHDARYLAADCADTAAIGAALDEAEATFGELTGVIQAVVDPVFGRTDRMTEAEFRDALRPKVAGLVALSRALAGRRGDPLLAVFSSIGAFGGFPGTAGQPAYCAACCFEAAFVGYLRQVLGREARLIHWGVWQHPALNPAMVERLAAQGCATQDAEASARALAGLLDAPEAPQLVHAALSPAVWAAMGASDPASPSALAEAARRAAAASPSADPALHAAMDAHARDLLAETFRRAGLLPPAGERWRLAELHAAWGVTPDQAGLAAALTDILCRAGEVTVEGGAVIGTPPSAHDETGARRAAALLARAGDAAAEAMRGALALLGTCVAALPDILAGRCKGTEVLFPGGSTELVAPLYRDQPALVACNAVTAAATAGLARARGAGDAPLQVLEIGAGTGASTAPVLAALEAAGVRFEYRWTDISPALVQAARARFGTSAGRHFAALDVTRAPEPQGFAAASADLVLASDVLHATPDVGETLSHVARLLRPGGVLLLNETTRAEDVATLTFGLLDGWWLARDRDRRLPHAPLLSIEGWARALRQAGFDAVEAVPAPGFPEAEAPPHAVLLARRAVRAADRHDNAAARPAKAAPPSAPPRTGTGTGSAGLQRLLAECVGVALELPAERIEPDAPFGEIGVDSIVAPQIVETVNGRLGIALRSTELYNFGSVEALARHVAAAFPDCVARLPDAAAQAATPVTSTAVTASAAPPRPDDIAIIGMSGRFPGAPDLDRFWEMIRDGRHEVRELDRFDLSPVLGARGEPGRAYARWAALLEEHDRFDPLFFGISPAEAEAMDPQQRLLLEEGWRALEDAGLPPQRLAGRACGVFVGVSASNYVAGGAPAALQTLGGSVAILSARLPYLLDLHGPCFPVDTGCSSSLVALHLACESLRRGESAVALAAGVSCNIISPHLFLYLSDAGMASPTGRCHSFDDAADGFVPGEGAACLVLRRVSDALRDGDRIHAVIRGSGINQDGRTSGLTAPSATSQTALETRIYRESGIDPGTIGLVEAHGTGTRLGDPIEVAALTDAFSAFTPRREFCALGSVKTNIGHTMAAAGMAGLAKAVLALRHRTLPPSLNFSRPNRHIDFARTPFFVNTAPRDWAEPAPGTPRRAAVSSFGFSGTNGHVVVEEAPEPAPPTAPAPGPRVVPVSARSDAALRALLHALADALERDAAPHDLADIAHTLACRRGHFRHRRAVVATDTASLPPLLRAAAGRALLAPPPEGADPAPEIIGAWQAGRPAEATALQRLASLHETGATVDWGALADGRRRLVTLPGHPFFREPYWAFDPLADFRAPAPAPAEAPPHPLLGPRLPASPPGTARFELALDPSLPLLRDHVVQGRRLLPGTAILAMLRAAASAALGHDPAGMRDIAWPAPATEGMHVTILAERAAGGVRCTLRDATEGTALAHATVDTSMPPAPAPQDLAALRARCARALPAQEAYAAFAALGFDYGPGLRVMQELLLGEGEALARLIPAAPAAGMTEPSLLDGALQAAAAIGLAAGPRSGDAGTYVPAGLDAVEVHALPPADASCWAHALLRPGSAAEEPCFDVRLLDDAGQPLVTLRGMRARRLRSAAAASAPASTLVFQPVWQEAPLRTDEPGPPGDILLLTCDPALAGSLRAALPPGRRVVEARPGETFRQVGADRFELDPTTPADVAGLLEAALPEAAPAPLIIVNALRLSTAGEAAPPITLARALADMGVEEGVRPLFLLAHAALARPAPPRLALMHLEAEADSGSFAAASAFLRSLLAETGFEGRALAVIDPAAAPTAIAEELTEGWAAMAEGARDATGRRRLRGRAPVALPDPAPSWVRPGSAWLITGGLGKLGLALARHLAAQGAGRIALLSRRAAGPQDEAALEAAGGPAVLHLRADVADPAGLRGALDALRRQFGPLHGVAHAAGLLRDARVARQDVAEFDAVLAPKAAGAVALDHLTAADPLDAFILFSSTAAELGVPGQAAYAAANGFLGGFAARRHALVTAGRRRGATIAIDWPLWEEGGMRPPAEVVAELDRRLGLLAMPQTEGLRVLDAALALGAPRLLVLHGRSARLTAAIAGPSRAPLASSPAVPSAMPGASAVEAYLAGLLAEVIRLPVDRLDLEERIEEYGLDSIGIMRLNARLEADLGEVSKTLFFEHRTVRDIAARLLRDHAGALAARLAPEGSATDSAAAEPLAPQSGRAPSTPAIAPAAPSGDIAIIGMSGLYPQAGDLDRLWDNLREGRDCITEIPPERWAVEGFWDPDRTRPETSYTKWGGFIADADRFDARFFGISPVEAESLDPQARKFLEICWAALEDAGLTRETLFRGDSAPERRRGGVFAGAMNGDYALFGPEEAARGNLIGPNAAYWNIANRVSWVLDLHGPSMAVDTACSASLSAVHAACQALRAGECSVALAGGANLILHPSRHWILSKSGFASSDGRCRSFGMGGDGYVPGEGVGAVLLKPLERALADGDRIHAVIKGSAVNHGGRSSGFTVPDPVAQGALVTEALERAGTPPGTISYIEAHGTGTALGDPVEVTGLARAFAGMPAGSLPIGSVKSGIGHLEAAAGIAGLTKVVLQMRHGLLAPSLHAETLNPDLGLARTPLTVQRSLAPWPRPAGDGRRRAGVSSFGAGGSNAHLVLEEAPAIPAPPAATGPFVVPLSAATGDALRRRAAELASWLRERGAAAPALADIARTLQIGREAMRHRAAYVAASLAELLQALDALAAEGRSEGLAVGEVRRPATEAAAPEASRAAPPAELASLWAAGAARIDWDRVAPGRRPPVSLPTYPFEKRRCWVALTPRQATATPAPVPELLAGVSLDPPGAEGLRRVTVAADAPVLAEHRVGGRPVLPGALLLELALRATGSDALAGWRFHRPADMAAPDAGLAVGTSPEGGVTILGAATDVRIAGGRISGDALDPGVELPAPEVLLASCPQRLEGETAYALLASAGATYSGAFRRLAWIRRGSGAAVARLKDGARSWAEVLDAAFQLTFAVLPEDGAAGPFLPAGLAHLHAPGRPERVTSIAALRREATDDRILLDLMLADAEGEPQAVVRGFEARRATTAAPPPLEAWYAVWEAAPPPPPPPAAPPRRPCLLAPHGDPVLARAAAATLGTTPADSPSAGADAVWLLAGGVEWADPAATAQAAVLHMAGLVRMLAAEPTPPRLVVVTAGAHRARPGERPDPVAAAIAAFARAAGREHPELRLALLDIDPGQPGSADRLPALAAPGADLALRAGGPPLRRRFAALDLPMAEQAPCRPGGVVLIAGGAGGLGRAMAEHLAASCAARVALLGRSAPSPEVEATLARCCSVGGQAIHLRADLTDGAALDAALAEAERRLGRIEAVVHAAMELRDGRIAAQADADIARVLAPKTSGLTALHAALERLEGGRAKARLILFSTANAETANPGQAAYAAASAFADAFALSLADRPVLVLDWGFWGEVGRVATSAHHAALTRIGVHPIGTAEGLALLGRMLAAPALDRAMPLRVGAGVAAELGADGSRRLAVLPGTPARLLPAALAAAGRVQAEGGAVLDGAAPGFAAINRHAAMLALESLHAAGLRAGSAAAMEAALDVAPAQRRFFAAVLDLLARAGLLEETGDGVLRPAPAPDPAALARAVAALAARDPAAAPYLRLLEACTAGLPEVLAGRRDANAVLFPGGSMDLVAPIYAGNPVVDHLQAVLAEGVAAAVAARLAELGPEGRVRVLEVGAGTGGTTRFVLRALAPFAPRVEYLFTDIGPAFLAQAEQALRPEAPFLRTARLDIAAPPAAQGFEAGGFDVVVAANVLHATPRIAATLAHVKAPLRPGGVLAINEATAAQDFNTLTFGMTRGWWLFDDPEHRLPHAPLLDPPRWRARLAEAGFAGAAVLGAPELQCVLIASSDGLAAAVPEAGPAKRTTTPGAAAASPLGGAGDDIEDRLRVTVAAALRLAPEEVEPDTSFAEYGADSIISVELVRRVNEAFGIDLKTTALFNYATVRELAGYIRLEHGTAAAAAAAPVGAELADRITGSKERSDRLRRLIRRRLESGVPLPAVAEEPTPRPAEAAPVRQDAPPPRPAGDEDGLGSVLRRLAAGEICYADAMTIPLTDA